MMAAVIGAPAAAGATDRADWTSQGGATADAKSGAMDVSIGFPSMILMAHLPIVKHLEVDPFAEIFYWDNISTTTPFVGTNLGARLKLNMVDRGKLQIAMMADLSAGVVFYHIENGDNVGSGFNLRLTFPQFIISGRVTDKLHLFGGVKFPMTLYVSPAIEFSMVIAGNFGIEMMLTKRLNFFISVDCGPEIRWGNRKLSAVQPADPNQVTYDKGAWNDINGWLSTSVGLSVRF